MRTYEQCSMAEREHNYNHDCPRCDGAPPSARCEFDVVGWWDEDDNYVPSPQVWLIIVTFPLPNPPMVRFVKTDLLSPDLKERLVAGDGNDYNDALSTGVDEEKVDDTVAEFEKMLAAAEVDSCHVEKVLTYYVG